MQFNSMTIRPFKVSLDFLTSHCPVVSKEIKHDSLVGLIYTVAVRDNKDGAGMINFNILGVVLLAGYFKDEDPKKVAQWFANKPAYRDDLEEGENGLQYKKKEEEESGEDFGDEIAAINGDDDDDDDEDDDEDDELAEEDTSKKRKVSGSTPRCLFHC